MEYHASPLSLDVLNQVQIHKKQFQECLLAAFILEGNYVEELIEQTISGTETHYWPIPAKNAESLLEVMLSNHREHLGKYAQMYKQYTDIPAADAMLVETIKFVDKQVSASWEFKLKNEARRSQDR